MANGNFGGGSGTLADPFLVEDAEDLNAARDARHYKQVKDIDLSGYTNWSPTGSPIASVPVQLYDGNGYTISNLKINSNSNQDIGLFGFCPRRVENLNIVNANVRRTNPSTATAAGSGVLSGSSAGGAIINNVTVSGAVISPGGNTGGLIGIAIGSYISNCASHCYVTGVNNVGCLLGNSEGTTILNCRVDIGTSSLTGLKSSGSARVGGMVGTLGVGSKISYCSSIVTDVSGTNEVGGLIGMAAVDTIIDNCESYGGYVVGTSRVGGLVGHTDTRGESGSSVTIENVISRGVNVEGESNVGGLVGGNSGSNRVRNYSWCYIYYPRIVRTRGTATSFYDLCEHWSAHDTVTGGSGYVVDNLEFYSRV